MSKFELARKKSRGPSKASAALRQRIIQVVEESAPLSVRHLFYRCLDQRFAHVSKSERGYARVVYLKRSLCLDGALSWSQFTDATRYVIGHGSGYSGLNDDTFKDKVRELYRRDVWQNTGLQVQIWVEARSLAPSLSTITDECSVDVYAAGGQPSDSFVYQAAATIVNGNTGGRAVVLYAGDLDPAGLDISRNIEIKLREMMVAYCKERDWPPQKFVPELEFQQVALTQEQVRVFDLPSRPVKPGQSRHNIVAAVECESLPPSVLRNEFRRELEALMPSTTLEMLRVIEAAEQDDLATRLSRW